MDSFPGFADCTILVFLDLNFMAILLLILKAIHFDSQKIFSGISSLITRDNHYIFFANVYAASVKSLNGIYTFNN